ncbi:MAG: OB-fold domain-containing protein [Chloroflexi bacterium]|nr:OB-fold domain-containing protein [Chloroflexota bacterium]
METKLNDIPPVAPGIFTLPPYDEASPTLLGGYCPDCDRRYFPRPKHCPGCLGPIQETTVGSAGTIYSYTIVRIKPPLGFPSPYSVVYVDLAESGLRVFGLFDPEAIDQLRIGLEVNLAVEPLGHNGQGEPRLRPYFTPRK